MNKLYFTLLLTVIMLGQSLKVDCQSSASDYYYTYYNGGVKEKFDTMILNSIHFHKRQDSLIDTYLFHFKNQKHMIKIYHVRNNSNPPFIGGSIVYELDSLGIFFDYSTRWPSYSRLHCHNKTMNDLIDIALEISLSNHSFREKVERVLEEEEKKVENYKRIINK